MFVSDLMKRKAGDEPVVTVEVIESSVSVAAALVPSASKTSDALLPPPQPQSPPQQQQAGTAATTAATTTATATTTTTGESDGLKKSRPTTKSKKKKNVPAGENTGRWTAEEHRLFLQGLEQHGKGWKKIAGLIKSRTVVQIRTHAQKYFQKLAKARQNGEDGDVGAFEAAAVAISAAPPLVAPKRRRLAGTKRKSIQSVVASAQRQGKKLAIAQAASGVPNPMAPLPAISPILAHFVISSSMATATTAATSTDEILAPGTVTGQELEDAVFRFLTPRHPADAQINEIARQAGAVPITVPQQVQQQNGTISTSTGGGNVSPSGVNEMISIYPSWTDTKETPSWYANGEDINALLDVADGVDWLADMGGGDDEGYDPPPVESISLSTLKDSPSGASILDDHLQVFDTPIDEQAFVSTILSSDVNSQASDN